MMYTEQTKAKILLQAAHYTSKRNNTREWANCKTIENEKSGEIYVVSFATNDRMREKQKAGRKNV